MSRTLPAGRLSPPSSLLPLLRSPLSSSSFLFHRHRHAVQKRGTVFRLRRRRFCLQPRQCSKVFLGSEVCLLPLFGCVHPACSSAQRVEKLRTCVKLLLHILHLSHRSSHQHRYSHLPRPPNHLLSRTPKVAPAWHCQRSICFHVFADAGYSRSQGVAAAIQGAQWPFSHP